MSVIYERNRLTLWGRAVNLIPVLTGRKRQYEAKTDAEFVELLAKKGEISKADDDKERKLYVPGYAEETIAGVKTILRNNSSKKRAILYIHGGGFWSRPIGLQKLMINRIAKGSDAAAFMPLYTLLPNGNAELAVEQCEAVLDELINRYSPENVFLVGDSAGGHVCLSLCIKRRNEGKLLPAKIALFSPWLNLSLDTDGMAEYEKKDLCLASSGLRKIGQKWIGDASKQSLDVPSCNLSALPPIITFVGTAELLLPDILRFDASAEKAGVEHSLCIYKDAIHVFACYMTPEGVSARRKTVNFFNT